MPLGVVEWMTSQLVAQLADPKGYLDGAFGFDDLYGLPGAPSRHLDLPPEVSDHGQ